MTENTDEENSFNVFICLIVIISIISIGIYLYNNRVIETITIDDTVTITYIDHHDQKYNPVYKKMQFEETIFYFEFKYMDVSFTEKKLVPNRYYKIYNIGDSFNTTIEIQKRASGKITFDIKMP